MIDETSIARNRAVLRSFCNTIGKFRALSPTMPVGEVQMFLLVALNEGASMTDLAIEADMRKATASRYLLDLSDKNRLGQPGFGLVSREVDPQELRRNVYSLTPKGRSLVNDLINQK